MQTIDAIQGGARTYLVHTFGRGLDGEDRFVVERFKAMVDGDIRPIDTEARDEGSARHEAHRGLAQVGRGDASGPHGNHRVYRVAQQVRPTDLGGHRHGNFPRPPPEG